MTQRIRTGLEMEFFVVDGNLRPYNEAYKIPEKIGNQNIKQEFGTYQLEISTKPHFSLEDLEDDAERCIVKLMESLPSDVRLLPIGAYPLPFEPEVTPDERLKSIVESTNRTYSFERNRGVELETALQSVQMNFSVGNGHNKSIINLNNILRRVIPYCIALSANSPYFFGKDVRFSEILMIF